MSARRAVLIALLMLGATLSAPAQNGTPDSIAALFLRVVIPETTYIQTGVRQRIAASTLPSARAFINGSPAKVWPTGAFVGIVPVDTGANTLTISVVGPQNDTLTKTFTLFRPTSPQTSPVEPEQFDTIMIEPRRDLWVRHGDIVELRVKGSPGQQVFADIDGAEEDIPMTELDEKEANGLKGVYVGNYAVKEDDNSEEGLVRYRMNPGFFGSTKTYAKGKISIYRDQLPRTGQVRGRRPFINAGLGTDRLGGARLGYIDPGVKVTVDGKRNGQYRIRLSGDMVGWIPDDNVSLLPPSAPLPKSLAGSVSVSGNNGDDIVLLSLRERLPYTSDMLLDPARIIVDVYGAMSNTNWITHHLSAQNVGQVSWDQVAEGHYRLTIALKSTKHWGYRIDYQGTSLRIRVRRPPVVPKDTSAVAGMTIAIDAGHGGPSPWGSGALGATGTEEKEMTLSIAQMLKAELERRGANVVMTRDADSAVGMLDRMERIVASGAQVAVSVHCNSIPSSTDAMAVKGSSTYYRYTAYAPLANALYKRLLTTGLDQWGVVGSFNFAVNYLTEVPNALAEIAFMSNPEDEMKLLDPAFRAQVAAALADGIEDFLRQQ